MPEEVKIHIATDGDTRAIAEAEAEIQKLYKAASVYESKGMETAAKSARADARDYEKDILRLKKEQVAEAKLLNAEQRAGNASGATGGRGMRGIIGRGARGGLVGALAFGAEEFITDTSEREGIANRDIAARSAFQRKLSRQDTLGASSASIYAEELNAKEEADALKDKRADLERQQKYGTWKGAALGIAAGAGTGFMLGGGLPGAIIGGIAGGITGGVNAHLSGSRAKDENEAEIKRREDEAKKLEDERKRRVKEDVDLDMARTEAVGRRDFREVRGIQDKITWLKKYYELKSSGVDQWKAQESASMEVFSEHQERLQALGSRLVNARSGAGDAARAAQLADPNSDLRRSIDAMHHTMAGQLRQTNDHLSRDTFGT